MSDATVPVTMLLVLADHWAQEAGWMLDDVRDAAGLALIRDDDRQRALWYCVIGLVAACEKASGRSLSELIRDAGFKPGLPYGQPADWPVVSAAALRTCTPDELRTAAAGPST